MKKGSYLVLLFAIGTVKVLGRHQTQNGTQRIIGGTYCSITSCPYQVSLNYWKSTKYEYVCGGSLISTKYVLTAGHCCKNLQKEYYLVKAGYDGLWNVSPNQISYVDQMYTHEQFYYAYNAPVNDIALMKLSQPFTLNSNVQTIPLPAAGSSPSNSFCTITGFGKTKTSDATSSPYLMKADVPIISRTECIATVSAWIPSTVPPVTDNNICTMSYPTKGSCTGDGGSPLTQDGKLIGVVSWGVSPCELNRNPTVYTEVSKYLYWIYGKMAL